VATSRNTQAKSILDTIKSLAENVGDPNTEVTIHDTALDDTFVSTTRDVDATNPTVGSIGGVGTMEGVLTISDKKNDWGSLAYLPTSPLCGSNSIVAPRGSEAQVTPLVTITNASICAILTI
jgi:hypothetical protein